MFCQVQISTLDLWLFYRSLIAPTPLQTWCANPASAKRPRSLDSAITVTSNPMTFWRSSKSIGRTPSDFRLFEINVVRKIVDKKAQVYRNAPVRTFEGADQEATEELYTSIGVNIQLKKANRLTKLHKTTMMQVGWDGERLTLSVITPNILDVLHDGDPEKPHTVIVTHPGAKDSETTYSVWTAEKFERRDCNFNVIANPGNPGNVNPYRALPFIPLFDYAPDDQFFLAGGDDLIEAQQAINVALANLWRAIEWQSHGQAWISGVDKDDPFSGPDGFGPNSLVKLPKDGKFGFAAPNTPLAQVLASIEFLIKQTAVSNDLAANVFEIDRKAESAAAKIAENRDLLEARQDDIALWRRYEQQLFEVIKIVANTHLPGTIAEGAELKVDFGEVSEDLNDKDKLEVYQRRIDMGIWTVVDAYMAFNPDIRDRDEAVRILQERQQEASVLGSSFAGPPFPGNDT